MDGREKDLDPTLPLPRHQDNAPTDPPKGKWNWPKVSAWCAIIIVVLAIVGLIGGLYFKIGDESKDLNNKINNNYTELNNKINDNSKTLVGLGVQTEEIKDDISEIKSDLKTIDSKLDKALLGETRKTKGRSTDQLPIGQPLPIHSTGN